MEKFKPRKRLEASEYIDGVQLSTIGTGTTSEVYDNTVPMHIGRYVF